MARTGIVNLLCRPGIGLLCTLLIRPLEAGDLAASSLRIESTPPGAEVFLIGGRSGQTPLEISEREIYPNDYPDDQAYLYGTVTLRHAGCTPRVHRVTLEDIELGLHITLDCEDETLSAGASTHSGTLVTPASLDSGTTPPTESESLYQRRLRQLQVLQELLDEGLMSADEERRIRRRLLEMP